MTQGQPSIEKISAVTLATADMRRAVGFYTRLGFSVLHGGPEADFTSLGVGDGYLNLALRPGYSPGTPWGRTIFYVSDVDAMYQHIVAQGLKPDTQPEDAPWRERYFHILDPDGHELSFARPIRRD